MNMTGDRKKMIVAVAVLFVVGFVLYGNTLHNVFIADDHLNIENNTFIRSLNNIGQYFSHDLAAGAGESGVGWYRPLLLISYALDYKIWGLDVVGYHLGNIFIHIFSAIILFFIVIRLFCRISTAFIASLLFLAHPIQTEAVTFMSGRADLLMVFFSLLSLHLFLLALSARTQKKRVELTVAYITSYILALFSKETAIVFPALLALVYISFVNKSWCRVSIKATVLKILPTALISFLYIILRSTIWNFEGFAPYLGGWAARNIFLRTAVFISVIPDYFKMLLLPIDLHYRTIISIPIHLFILKFILSILLLLVLAVIVWKWKARRKLFIFGFGWFFISLLPASNIFVGINFLLGERWLYLAAIGLFVVVAVLISDLLDNRKIQKIVLVVLAVMFAIYTVIVVRINIDWKNEINFFSKELKYSPDSARLHGYLALAYAANKQTKEAYAEFQKSIELNPGVAEVHFNFAKYAQSIKDMPTAIAEYRKFIQFIKFDDQTFIPLHVKIISFFVGLNDYDDAIIQAKAIQDALPNSWVPYYLLGQVYALEKDNQNAQINAEKALQLNPGYPNIQKLLDTIKDTR